MKGNLLPFALSSSKGSSSNSEQASTGSARAAWCRELQNVHQRPQALVEEAATQQKRAVQPYSLLEQSDPEK